MLYRLNEWFFETLAFSERVSWIFLPAALRMLAVLAAGWVGALGIFVGSLITAGYSDIFYDTSTVLVLAGLSALSPVIALLVGARVFGIKSNLEGLQAGQLIGLSVLVAAFAAVLHSAGFMLLGLSAGLADSLFPMFVGDLLGTLLFLYLARLIINVWVSRHRGAAS
jgi:hypothetical protein